MVPLPWQSTEQRVRDSPHYERQPALTVEIDVAGVVDDLIEFHAGRAPIEGSN
jgi:hypothetical protein